MCTPVNESNFNKNAYMHDQTTIEIGVRIVDRKNLNWCTPFSAVNLCATVLQHIEGPNLRLILKN